MPSCTASAPRQNIAAMPAPSAMPPPPMTGMPTALTTARTTHEGADFVRRRMAAGLDADRDDGVDAGGFRLAACSGEAVTCSQVTPWSLNRAMCCFGPPWDATMIGTRSSMHDIEEGRRRADYRAAR